MGVDARLIGTFILFLVVSTIAALTGAQQWSDTPEGVAQEFIAALDNLDLDRIMATQAVDATMFFPHANATFRMDGREEIRGRMADAIKQGLARARVAGRTTAPYLNLPKPIELKVQMLTDDAAVVTWMFDRPGNFGRRSAAMRRENGQWRMVNFHSSNLLNVSPSDAGSQAESDSPPGDTIDRILASTYRPDVDLLRDEHRRPADILRLAGIKNGDIVIELYPGSAAYYSRILAGVVGPTGKVYAITPPYVAERVPGSVEGPVTLAAELLNYDSIVADFHQIEISQKADVIWMVNVYHDSLRLGYDKQVLNKYLYSLLKPGGTLLIVDHHAEDGSGDRDGLSLHRVDAQMTRRELEAAGFKLVASSDILSNDQDDRTKLVFDPTVRGRTDRFVYVFRR